MPLSSLLPLLLGLSLAAPPPPAELPVCGVARAADGAEMPAAARARLLPLESDRAWGLGVLAGRAAPEPAAEAALDSGGRFCLPAPAPGMWEVVVGAPGLVPMTYSPLPVSGPLELPEVRLARDAGARVVVRGADGAPVAGVWVAGGSATPRLLARLAAGGWRLETRLGRSDGDGRVSLARLPGEELEVQGFTAGGLEVAIARLRGSGELRLAWPPAPRTVEVRDERGAHLAGVVVTLAEHGWPVAASDREGRVTLAGGASGPVPLFLEGADGRGRRVALPAPPAEASGADQPTGRGAAARLELATGVPLRGRVVAAGGRPAIAGAMVWIGPDPGAFALSGPGGEYALPAGGRERLTIQAVAPGFLSGAGAVDPADAAAGRGPELALQPAVSAAGRVVDERGAPVAGVAVVASAAAAGKPVARPPDGSFSRAATDASGRFELARLRPGAGYELELTRAGYARLAVPVAELPPGPRVDLGTLVLEPGVVLAGRVTDRRGAPLAGAEVRLRPSAGLPSRDRAEALRGRPPDATTGADGRFFVADLRHGRALDLLTTREGYLPEWTLGVEAPSPEPVKVALGEASRVAGIVTDETGEPVPGARVALRHRAPPAGTVGVEPVRRAESRTAASGAGGEFRFDELTPGAVEIEARAEELLPGPPIPLELAPGTEVAGVEIVLRRGAVIEGRALDARGEPVVDAELRAGPVAATSGADGGFRLAGVPPGVLGLFGRHPEYRRLVQEVHVEPGVNGLDLYFEDGWSISGRTGEEGGEPLAGVRVEVRSESLRAPATYATASDREGRFRVVVSEAGSYRLSATRDGFARRDLAGLEVRTAPLEDVEVTLSRGASVSGRLLGLAVEELAGVSIAARREGAVGAAVTAAGAVDHLGRYAVRHLGAGDWRITAELAGGRRRAEATVALAAGVREVERDLEFGAGVRLTGRLLHAGEPLSGAHVTLIGRDESAQRSVLSSHDGSFRIEDLEPGRYRLDVLEPARALSHVEDLELAADLDLFLELRASPLTGRVVAADTGEPLADALVFVRKLFGGSGEPGSLTTVGTDASGGFTLARLTPGRYLVSARKDGYAPAEQRVEVRPGEPAGPALLRLPAAGGLTLTVRLDTGEVPGLATVSAFDAAGRRLVTDTRPLSDKGFVHFAQFPPGAWNLLVSTPGAAPAWITATVPGAAEPVLLSPAAPLTVRVPALLDPGGAATLAVFSPAGETFFQIEPGGAMRTRWTLSGGSVTLADVPAGVWSLRVDGVQGRTWFGTAVTDGRTPSQVSLE